jgi:hypothetical protein
MIPVPLPAPRSSLPPSEQDPEEVRRAAERILDGPDYRQRSPSLLERGVDWVLDRIGDVFEAVVGVVGGGGAGSVVALVLAALVVGLLAWVLRHADWATLRRGPRDDEAPVTVFERGLDIGELRRRAAAAETSGDRREALRLWFAVLVAELARRGVVDGAPGRTVGEYRSEVSVALPAAAAGFRSAADLFEGVWYGDRPVDADASARMRALTEEVVALTPEGAVAGVTS